jgi:hypothetical protein
MKRLVVAAICAIVVICAVAVAMAAISIRNHNQHEHALQLAYDRGRIDRARFLNASPQWQKGWNWQMAQQTTSGCTPEDLKGWQSEAVGQLQDSDLFRGCDAALISRAQQQDRSEDEKVAYLLGSQGLPR